MKFRLCFAALLFCPTISFAQKMDVQPLKSSAVYAPGETVVWNIQLSGAGADAVKAVHYSVKRDAATEISSGTLPLTGGAAHLEARLDAPGALLATFTFKNAAGEDVKADAGAIVDPFKIAPSSPEPGDFLSFWKSKVEELETIPQNPVLKPIPSDKAGTDYSQITLDNIRGTKVRGQIARPSTGDKFPAMLILQYAGVYGLPKWNVTNPAGNGWLALNINAHDLPIDETDDFYKAQAAGPLKNYTAIGEDDRETSYFLRMVLSCYRAIDYLKTRPDWDGKTLVVTGTSQGGMQSLMMGGLNPAVTAVVVNVAAGCDNTASLLGRLSPWPYWIHDGRDKPQIMETSRYYDALNFARHITAPTLMAVGLIDVTAVASGDVAAFNQIQTPNKKLVLMPRSDHHGTGGTQADFGKYSGLWFRALAKGEPVPLGDQ